MKLMRAHPGLIEILGIIAVFASGLLGCQGPYTYPHLRGCPLEDAMRLEFSVQGLDDGPVTMGIESPEQVRSLLTRTWIEILPEDRANAPLQASRIDLTIVDVFNRRFAATRVSEFVYEFEDGLSIRVDREFPRRVCRIFSRRIGRSVKLFGSSAENSGTE